MRGSRGNLLSTLCLNEVLPSFNVNMHYKSILMDIYILFSEIRSDQVQTIRFIVMPPELCNSKIKWMCFNNINTL
jgi:hypothetical protein